MQTYTKMKDSGVDWLGDIPEEWNIGRVSTYYRRKKDRNHIEEELLSVYRDYGVVPKKSRDDNHNVESADLSNYQLVLPGDLVTNKMKTWQGSIAISNHRGIVSPAYFIFEPLNENIEPRFVHYLLRSKIYIAQYLRFSKGIRIGQWDLEYEQFKNFPILLPSTPTQQKIADYLDKETAKIDALITKQEKLLQLLEEKRRTTITQAVTRGLNPHAKMKDSGVDWLGDIPEGWSVARLSRLFTENKNTNKSSVNTNPVKFKFGEIVSKDLDIDSDVLKEIERYIILNTNDIAVNGLNLNYDFVTKRVARAKHTGCMTPAYIIMTPSEKISPIYYEYLLKAIDDQKIFNGWGTGIRLTLNFSELKKKQMPLPSMDEQQKIADFLDKETAKIDLIKKNISKQIELLKERRTSLISNAVTGKIKV